MMDFQGIGIGDKKKSEKYYLKRKNYVGAISVTYIFYS